MFTSYQLQIGFLTIFLLLLTREFQQTIIVLYRKLSGDRKLKVINIEAFKADIKCSELIRYPKTNTTELAQ